MVETKQVPIEEGLFTWPSDDPQLLASRCTACGSVAFPKVASCLDPDCHTDAEVEEIALSKRGKLDRWTIMRYQPPPPWKGPESMVPFGQGFVSLPEGVAVAAVLTSADPEDLVIGRDMELVIEKLYNDDDGNEVMSYRFRPV